MFPTAGSEDIIQVTSLGRNSSPHRNVRDPPESPQQTKPSCNREITLKMLIKEMIVCLALALTTYGALYNSPSQFTKHPRAMRFFEYDSVVTDWYKGQLNDALSSVNNAELSFVMYYAPWDAESQHVRGEFEKAAEVLGDLVQFLAINCWNPGSECRIQHNKIPSWPILMVYTLNGRGVLYKGPRDAHSMLKFLELIMKPLERISSTEDLVSLLSSCDAVAVGYTPLAETSKYYSVWYQVALRMLEFDALGEICFAAVTSVELALDLGVDSLPSARLMLWNETKDFTVDLESDPTAWNVTALMSWVLESFTQPVARLVPMWKKAFTFERYADGSPILMLFTPLNPLYKHLPAFTLLREVAMEYYDCNTTGSHWTAELIKLQQVQRQIHQDKDYVKFCQEHEAKQPTRKPKSYQKKEVISRNNKYPSSNITQKTHRHGLFHFLEKRELTMSKVLQNVDDNSELLALGLPHDCSSKVLPAEKSYYDHFGQCQIYEDNAVNEYRFESTSMLPVDGDPYTADNLIKENVKHFCKLTMFAIERNPVVKVKIIDNENTTHVRGLSCRSNNSLNILAVDSVRNHHFAESLGVDIMKKKDMTAVVILDSKEESQYLLSEEFTAKSVREFIQNFTRNNLKRSLRTLVDKAAHTHHFGSEGLIAHNGTTERVVPIVDLTTRTFRKFIRCPGTLSMVAVCGGECSAHTTRSLLVSSRWLLASGMPVQAARLDALRHDLRWHYTVDTYPAVLVFAAKRNYEDPDSVALPRTARISPGSLAALALRSIPSHRRLRVRLLLCAHAHVATEKKTCLKDLKDHVTALITRNLKFWRITEDQQLKQAFLQRLQHLNQVYLYLSLVHISDLHIINAKHKILLDSLSILSQNWDINFLGQNFTDSENS